MTQETTFPGPLMLDIAGTTLTPKESQQLLSPVVGGLILFSRNYENPTQLKELITSIRAVNSGIIIAVDHEGGRVQRFREGFTRIPPMAILGKLYDADAESACQLAKDIGWLFASELRAFDIDISFAPVLDRDHGISGVIGDRAFSSSINAIVELSQHLIAGMNSAGMAATGKHFPGHGAVEADSHIDIPVDERSFEEIQNQDLCIFENVIKSGIQALMPAHVIYPAVSPDPAGFSDFWIKDQLRARLSFDGVVFSDDLTMEGASVAGDITQRSDAAFQAGCDMVLVCNQPEDAAQLAQHLEKNSMSGNARIARMRGRKQEYDNLGDLQSSERWQKISNALSELV